MRPLHAGAVGPMLRGISAAAINWRAVPVIRSIAVVLLPGHTIAPRISYWVWLLKREWEARGLRVDIVFGVAPNLDADLIFPHFDLSVLPDDIWSALQHYPLVVNRNIRDIRKTIYSQLRIHRGDAYGGPVIVKTVNNSSGVPDRHYRDGQRPPGALARLGRRFMRIPAFERRFLGRASALHQYHIFDSPNAVPRLVWKSPHLFVERFAPERRGDLYVLRQLIFCGDRHVGRARIGGHPLVKARSSTLQYGCQPPPEILAWRKRLGMDFGKFDYVMHDGQGILLDVNTTPTIRDPRDPRTLAAAARLAKGLIERFETRESPTAPQTVP